ncbi:MULTISPECIES: hypothetical protein [unclassified Streptomyces]|uniref:hypothetical protein n=1 Tax=unclassified Streptomyces TaxID=2593676 RepID=UPI002119FD88|nr:hypothetical protein [Streptomyces sp. 13-12-16]
MQAQQPYQVPAPPPPSVPPPRSRGPLVTALLVGLLVGGAGVGVAWALTGGTPDTDSSAGGDARGACGALAGLDESKLAPEDKVSEQEREQALYRFAGAFDLATAAAAGDSSYEPLAEAITRAHNRHRQVFEVDTGVKKELARARKICAGL